METCDLSGECKLYQKYQHAQDELWRKLATRYCKGSDYVNCDIRNHLKEDLGRGDQYGGVRVNG